MKKRGACFLLVVLLCLCVLAGCGGQSGFIEAKLPETFEISRMELTLEDYAIINQPVEGGYEIYLYALYEFPGDDVITAEKIQYAYENDALWFTIHGIDKDRSQPEDTRPGAQIGKTEEERSKKESDLDVSWGSLTEYQALYVGEVDEATGKRKVIVGGRGLGGQDVEDENKKLHVPLKEGPATLFIGLDNSLDRGLEENKQKDISFVLDTTADHIIERNADGTTITGGDGIDPLLKEKSEELIQEEINWEINPYGI